MLRGKWPLRGKEWISLPGGAQIEFSENLMVKGRGSGNRGFELGYQKI